MLAPVLLVRPEMYNKIKASMDMTIPYPKGFDPEWMQMVGLRIVQNDYIPQFTTVERRARRTWTEPKRKRWSYRPAYRTVKEQVPVLGWWISGALWEYSAPWRDELIIRPTKDGSIQPILMELER